MADDPKAAERKSPAPTAKREARFRDPRYREQESSAPGVNEMLISDVVDETLRSILDRRGWPEHTKRHARHNADVIRAAIQAVRNAPNRDFILNLVWAALSLGLNSGHSAEWIERAARERAKKSGAVRKENRPWVPHAKELALTAQSADPNASDEKLATEIIFRWRRDPDKGEPKCPSVRTLSKFVAELRAREELPQRARSLQKRARSLLKRTR
jgi:Arc/MetJ-type ribon-helix-helix transcriptional regulator